MNQNGDGPHGPGCKCSPEDTDEVELFAAGMAISQVLTDILRPLLDAWRGGAPGRTVHFKFERGTEVDGIGVNVGPLDESVEWPEEAADPDAMMAKLEAADPEVVH